MTTSLAGLLSSLALAVSAHAVTTVNGVTLGEISGLGDGSTFATWNTVHSNAATGGISGTGGFPGSGNWTSTIAAQGGNDTNSRLRKVANGTGGGPYAASASIYFGGFSGDVNNNGGTLGVGSTVPIADLSTVIFQVQIGEAWTYDFYNGVLPTLSYTTASGTVSGVTATFTSLYDKFYNGTVAMPTGDEAVYINSYALQWDLSGVGEEITAFEVSFSAVQHSQVYGMSLQQGNDGTSANLLPPAAIPEPSSLLIGSLGLVFLTRRKR